MKQRVHLIGIGGSGMSAIARILLERGHVVSGSDRQFTPALETLVALGATIAIGHQAENIVGADLVVRSSAIPDENPEVQAAVRAGVPVMKRSNFIGELMKDQIGVAIAGTHGKTTTTAMIAWMLASSGRDPSYIIGGISKNLGSNAHAGRGKEFVVEADEYDRMFLGMHPKIAVVTNIEHDHPDCFPTFDEFYEAFEQFAGQVQGDGNILICADDAGASRLLENAHERDLPAVPFGFSGEPGQGGPGYFGSDLHRSADGGSTFDAWTQTGATAHVKLRVPGEHNARNALAALAVGDLLELPIEEAARSLEQFAGTGRRLEVQGQAGGVLVMDDYAHHPTEIRATLSAIRWKYPNRPIWAVWQPHTYSRTITLKDDFASAFNQADHILVTEVYPAREDIREDFSAEKIVQQMAHSSAEFIPSLNEVSAFLGEKLQAGEILVVLSAGDADQISLQVLELLAGRQSNG